LIHQGFVEHLYSMWFFMPLWAQTAFAGQALRDFLLFRKKPLSYMAQGLLRSKCDPDQVFCDGLGALGFSSIY